MHQGFKTTNNGASSNLRKRKNQTIVGILTKVWYVNMAKNVGLWRDVVTVTLLPMESMHVLSWKKKLIRKLGIEVNYAKNSIDLLCIKLF